MGGHLGFVDDRSKLSCEFTVDLMAGPYGNDVRLNGSPDQIEIAYDIQDFVPHEFIRIPKRLIGQHHVIANDDGIFETPSFDQSVFDEELDFLVKTKGARLGYPN